MVALNTKSDLSIVTDQLLKMDPLHTAEQMTGKSYKDDRDTGMLGLALQMQKSKELQKILTVQDDVHHGTSFVDYIRIMRSIGFDIVYTELFKARSNPDEPVRTEKYYLMWHATKYILATIESYREHDVNSAYWYFSLKHNKFSDYHRVRCSYSFWTGLTKNSLPQEEWIMMGNADAREAIRHMMDEFDSIGKFVEWPEPQFLQLNTFMDWKDCKENKYTHSEELSKKRYDQLPLYIKDMTRGHRKN